MSQLPLRPCNQPGCPNLSRRAWCPVHSRYSRTTDEPGDRGTAKQRGYDKYHRRMRVVCFQRDEWRCVDCGWEPEIVRCFRQSRMGDVPPAMVLEELRQRYNRGARHLHADHIVPIESNRDLRLDLDNLATRCSHCHNARTMREQNNHRLIAAE